MIFNFNNFVLNEWISNEKLSNSHIKDMINKIQKKSRNKIIKKQYAKAIHNRYIEYNFRWIKDYVIFEKILKEFQNTLIRKGILINYHVSQDSRTKITKDLERDDSLPITKTFKLLVKDLYSQRTIPPRYLFHYTKEKHLDQILKEGLVPKSWKEGNWADQVDLAYPPIVFALVEYDNWKGESLIMIDTKGLTNKWWKDLNFFNEPGTEYGYDRGSLMTFESIPPENLKLIEKPYELNIFNSQERV